MVALRQEESAEVIVVTRYELGVVADGIPVQRRLQTDSPVMKGQTKEAGTTGTVYEQSCDRVRAE